uniref:DNA-directed RNA polymerase n=1 Tax=Stauridium tetras TaxID=271398 RepID=A0A2U8GJY7_9CHLO|nr:RNA polymerase beta subunit [Stauridium tetras]AWI68959.1 RNA polymerase beta subunit [Stauridium tetras]
MSKKNRYFLPDFVQMQRQSFLNFLDNGIIEEFAKRNPITNINKNIEIFFYPEYYRLTKPSYTIQQAVFYQKSYVSKLYIPVQYTDRKKKKIFLKWILISQLPLMTKRGHFVLNGSARVIVNQLVRSPGIYFRECFYEIYGNLLNSKPSAIAKRFYADIICLRGTWLRIEIDKDYCMWVRLKKGPKIPLLWFLIGMGLNEKMIFQSVISPNFLLKIFQKEKKNLKNTRSSLATKKSEKIANSKKNYFYVSNPPEAWNEIAKLLNLKKGTLNKKRTNIELSNRSITTLAERRKSSLSFAKRSSEGAQKRNNKKKETLELGRKWFLKKFMNPRTYDLSKQGRLSINHKLSLNLSSQQTTLTAQDLLSATDYLMKVEKGVYEIDDIDHLKNRRVRCSGDLIQIQFGIGLMRLEKAIRFKLNNETNLLKNFFSIATRKKELPISKKTNKLLNEKKDLQTQKNLLTNDLIFNQNTNLNLKYLTLNSIIQPKFINGALKEFFGTHPLSQFMDQINPLSEMTHKRRLSSLGPGGVSRDTATLAVRGIHSSHYGRICPIETPEGKNTGLVNSLTTYARVNSQGFIETPFYSLYKGQVQKNSGRIYFSAEKEEFFKIATPDLNISKINFLPKQKIPVRIGKDFIPTFRRYVSFIGISPVQMISIATALIPFLEHDDANRALMGSNMQRQAVPLVRSQRPFVGTGLEARAVSDSGHALVTSKSGYVLYVSGSKILLYSK